MRTANYIRQSPRVMQKVWFENNNYGDYFSKHMSKKKKITGLSCSIVTPDPREEIAQKKKQLSNTIYLYGHKIILQLCASTSTLENIHLFFFRFRNARPFIYY